MINLASPNRIDFLRAHRYLCACVLFFSAREHANKKRPTRGQV